MIKEFIDMPKTEKAVGKFFGFFSPNTWTTISLFLAIGGFWSVLKFKLTLAVILFTISNICDFIDGKVARYSNRATPLGAFWDGTADRFVDMLLILCFFFLDYPHSDLHMGILLFFLLFSTLLPPFIVAYANHRGAVPDPTEKVIWRIAFRIEYIILFLFVIALYPVSPVISYYLIWASLLLMVVTVIQSIVLVFIKSKLYE